MLTDRRDARLAPSAMGALMDPDFLRHAANDACAVQTSEQPERAPVLTILQMWHAETASLSAHLREWRAGRLLGRSGPQPGRTPWTP
jgi:hypothetical protein